VAYAYVLGILDLQCFFEDSLGEFPHLVLCFPASMVELYFCEICIFVFPPVYLYWCCGHITGVVYCIGASVYCIVWTVACSSVDDII